MQKRRKKCIFLHSQVTIRITFSFPVTSKFDLSDYYLIQNLKRWHQGKRFEVYGEVLKDQVIQNTNRVFYFLTREQFKQEDSIRWPLLGNSSKPTDLSDGFFFQFWRKLPLRLNRVFNFSIELAIFQCVRNPGPTWPNNQRKCTSSEKFV